MRKDQRGPLGRNNTLAHCLGEGRHKHKDRGIDRAKDKKEQGHGQGKGQGQGQQQGQGQGPKQHTERELEWKVLKSPLQRTSTLLNWPWAVGVGISFL